MSKLVITFNDIEEWEKDNNYEPGTIEEWVEDGDWLAIGEALNIHNAYDIKLIKEDK